MGRVSFGSVQSGVGLVAGLMSIVGAAYSTVQYFKPDTGEIRALVRAGEGNRPLSGTRVDIITGDTLVGTLLTGDDGAAGQTVREGTYRVRVQAPRFDPQTREVRVAAGTTADLHFQLAQQASAERERTSGLARPVSRGVGAAERFFRRLGL